MGGPDERGKCRCGKDRDERESIEAKKKIAVNAEVSIWKSLR